MKRNIPLLITFLVGVILILSAFIPMIRELSEETAVYFDIIAAFAFVLGGGNLLRAHGEKIYKKASGWGYSAVTVIAFLVTLAFGMSKMGVTPATGLHAISRQAGEIVSVTFDGTSDSREFLVVVAGGPGDATIPVSIDGDLLGEMKTDPFGKATQTFAWEAGDMENSILGELHIPDVLPTPNAETDGTRYDHPIAVAVGDVSFELQPYAWITGNYVADGSAFWYMYEYVYKPLQSTMFAMLAFYVASAAFRAFRARNAESVMLLGTAFIILLGRTAAGAILTSQLPETGLWSFFRIENLADWIMLTFNTAGNRAIMIGIALGIVATSLKVLLGIDRSYLGSDKG